MLLMLIVTVVPLSYVPDALENATDEFAPTIFDAVVPEVRAK